ncbi:MAG: 3-oxoacyl-ACP synthase [Actinobacteria bacterium 13_1_20CM_3_71_11]|nr:MAG: 3-oxoacyl-ACP synthase [Actinobacteria bacterium 13_1_20CM_3_71_11]
MRRVAITGVGLLTAVGAGRKEAWDALLQGQTGVRRVRAWDASALRTQMAAEIDDFVPDRYASRRALRMTTRNDQLAIAGAVLAMTDAGNDISAYDPGRAAAFVGGNKEISNPEHLLDGCLVARCEDGSADIRRLGTQASSAFYPLFYVEGLQSAALFYVSQLFGLMGANAYFHGTADVGLTAIGRAYRSIRRGESDIALAGGSDDASSWWTLSKMDGLGVLTDRNELGAQAFRPFDVDRSGSVLGEGASWLVLEEYEAATRRGATIYAEVTGFGSTFDGATLPTPEPSGAPLAVAIRKALDEARVNPDEVDYVASHGCATLLGDPSEARALASVFGPAGQPAVGSVKPATGHLVAGAGALNVAVCTLAVAEGAIPPTLNLERPDPDCPLDNLVVQAREARVRHAVAVARGLEGQQVALVVSTPGEERRTA